jgi:hypothetical protein
VAAADIIIFYDAALKRFHPCHQVVVVAERETTGRRLDDVVVASSANFELAAISVLGAVLLFAEVSLALAAAAMETLLLSSSLASTPFFSLAALENDPSSIESKNVQVGI